MWPAGHSLPTPTLGCSMAKVYMRVMVRRLARFAEHRILMEPS